MADALERYRAMRDFNRTPEPAGEVPADAGERPRFVVQEHHATSLHWDLRLERDGVLASWAVPKGIPPDPRQDHLAVHTEDHPIFYLDFHGTIPEGSYGAGAMTIWDRGTYECHKWSDREVVVTLAGQRTKGRYVLFHTGAKQWMLHRMDPPEDPGRQLMPEPLPSLVVPRVGPLPDDQPAWSFEADVGGPRILVAGEGGRVRVVDDGGADVTSRWPELRDMGPCLGAVAVVVEGEMLVTGRDGRPDPGAAARRAAASGGPAVTRAAVRHPATLLAADVLWLEGHPTIGLAFTQRRRLLDQLELAGDHWQTTPTHAGEGSALLAASRAQGLAGVCGRLLAGAYGPDAVRFTPT